MALSEAQKRAIFVKAYVDAKAGKDCPLLNAQDDRPLNEDLGRYKQPEVASYGRSSEESQ